MITFDNFAKLWTKVGKCFVSLGNFQNGQILKKCFSHLVRRRIPYPVTPSLLSLQRTLQVGRWRSSPGSCLCQLETEKTLTSSVTTLTLLATENTTTSKISPYLSYFSSGPIITCSIVQRSRGFATINRSSSSTSFKAGCAQPSNWFQFPVSRISLKQWTNSFRFQFFIIIISICLEVLLFLGRYCKKSVGPNALSLSLSLRYPSSLTF